MNKKELRRKYLQIRNSIPNREEKDRRILSFLMTYINDRHHCVGIYASFNGEADTYAIMEKLLSRGLKTAVSKTYPDHLQFFEIRHLEDLCVENPYGYKEPEESYPIEKKDIDLMIVPGVCFDIEHNRVGFGKGYYDRYLADYKGDIIGICYEEQISDAIIDTDEHDIKIPVIITDKKIRVLS